jgi:hypothetical protein
VSRNSDRGFWATDSAGGLQLIFREGDSVGDKVLRNFILLALVPSSPGQQRAWCAGDPTPRVIWRAEFGDGTAAVITTTVP